MKVFPHFVLATLLQSTVNLSSSSLAHAAKNGSADRSLEEKETYIVTFNNKEDRQDFVDSNPFGEIKSVFARGNSISIDLDTSEYAELQGNTVISNIAIDEIIQLPPFVPTGADLSSNITAQDTEVSSSINPLEVPYGINLVNALDVSDEFAEGMTVCVCDTGFDLGHPDLQVDNVDGLSFVNETWFTDTQGHGTHVTGTIAALHNSMGVVGVVRSGKMNLLVAQVLNSDGAGSFSSIINGIAWCAVSGANVINLSLGSYVSWNNADLIPALQDLLEMIVDFDDVLVVAAAGNSGVNNLGNPAVLPGVLSVGAVDENKQLAYFSTTNYDVELAAPGVNVVSTIPGSLGYGLWAPFSGTSMACPHVAGVAALVWSHFPWISAKTLREVLVQSATDLGDEGRDERFGFGLVDAKAAYDLLASGYTSGPSVEPSSSMSPSQSSSPSSEPSTSIAPSASKSPTSAPTPCDGEFLEVIVQTDFYGNETNWKISEWFALTIGDEILSGGKYPGNEQIVDHQSICLPSCEEDPMGSLYRFHLNDDFGDGGASYSILLNGKAIIESGFNTYTTTMASTFSTCGTGVFRATLAANPSVALTAVDALATSKSKSSKSKSSKSSRAKYSVALEPYSETDPNPRQFWIKTNHGYLMNFYTRQCLQHHKGALVMRECKEEKYHLSQSFVFTDDQTIMSLTASNPAIAVDASDSSLVFEEYLSLGNGPHAGNLWNIQKFLRVFYA